HQVQHQPRRPDDLANQLTNEFGELAGEAKSAALTAENDEVGEAGRTPGGTATPQSSHAAVCVCVCVCVCALPDRVPHQEAGGGAGFQLHRPGEQSWSPAVQPQRPHHQEGADRQRPQGVREGRHPPPDFLSVCLSDFLSV
ncbi:unnamed protein product, partial [Tetraodon nigroviridis]